MAISDKFLNPPQHIPTPTPAPNRGGPVACIGGPVACIERAGHQQWAGSGAAAIGNHRKF